MNDSSHHQRGSEHSRSQESPRPYLKRMHRDWRFWVAVLLMLAGMIIYVTTEDFAWLPRLQLKSVPAGGVGK